MIAVRILMLWGDHETHVAWYNKAVELPFLFVGMKLGFPAKGAGGDDPGDDPETVIGYVDVHEVEHDTTNSETRVQVRGSESVCDDIVRAGGWVLMNHHPEFGYGDRKT